MQLAGDPLPFFLLEALEAPGQRSQVVVGSGESRPGLLALLMKLEGLADEMLQRGLPGDHIKVLSAFRTPEYNRSVGNRTRFSRHIVGDAADIFVDSDGDDSMDDLNGDGRVNRRDAQLLLSLVDEMDASEAYAALVGGASAYRGNASHGPFVHVDTRGTLTRW